MRVFKFRCHYFLVVKKRRTKQQYRTDARHIDTHATDPWDARTRVYHELACRAQDCDETIIVLNVEIGERHGG